MGMERDFWPSRKYIDFMHFITACWGKYLDLKQRKKQQTEEYDLMENFVICALTENFGYKIKEKMAAACGTQSKNGRCIQNFTRET
jgi:hypothetical protein